MEPNSAQSRRYFSLVGKLIEGYDESQTQIKALHDALIEKDKGFVAAMKLSCPPVFHPDVRLGLEILADTTEDQPLAMVIEWYMRVMTQWQELKKDLEAPNAAENQGDVDAPQGKEA